MLKSILSFSSARLHHQHRSVGKHKKAALSAHQPSTLKKHRIPRFTSRFDDACDTLMARLAHLKPENSEEPLAVTEDTVTEALPEQRHDENAFQRVLQNLTGLSETDNLLNAVEGGADTFESEGEDNLSEAGSDTSTESDASSITESDVSEETDTSSIAGSDTSVESDTLSVAGSDTSQGADNISVAGDHSAQGGHDATTNFDHRLHDFQADAVPDTLGEIVFGTTMDTAMATAGGIGILTGMAEKKHARHDRLHLQKTSTLLKEKKRAFEEVLQSAVNPPPGENASEKHIRLQRMKILQNHLVMIDWELNSIESGLYRNRKMDHMGNASTLGGLASLSKAVIDIVSKSLALTVGSVGAGFTAAVSAAGLGMGTAGTGLYMAVRSKKLSGLQRKEIEQKIKLAMEEIGVAENQLPADIREDFRRFFSEGKWLSLQNKSLSFDNMMKWFVGGMSGYTGTMTGLSIAKVVALLAGGAVALDLTISAGAITATTVALLGIYGFVRYNNNINSHHAMSNIDGPDIDLGLMRQLFASGDTGEAVQYAVETLRFIEKNEQSRQDFLYDIASHEGLRFTGLKVHSTDTAEVTSRRKQQRREQNERISDRFVISNGLTAKKMQAHVKSAGKYVSRALNERGSGDARRHAARTYARHTDVLTEERLSESINRDPKQLTRTLNYMGNQTDAFIQRLDSKIAHKIRLYELESEDPISQMTTTQQASESVKIAKRPDVRVGEKKHRLMNRVKHLFNRHQPKSAPPASPASSKQLADEHFQSIVEDIKKDKRLYIEALALRQQLEQLKSHAAPDAAMVDKVISRFHSLQQWGENKLGEADTKTDGKGAEDWARHMMHSAAVNYKNSRKRLNNNVLDVVSLAPAARLMRQTANATPFTQGWNWYTSSEGAPQIGGQPGFSSMEMNMK